MIIGDVDNDGKVSINDALHITRAIQGLVVLNDEQLRAADVDGDGIVSDADRLLLTQYLVLGPSAAPLIGQPISRNGSIPVIASQVKAMQVNPNAIWQDGNPQTPFLGLVGWLGGAQFQQAFIVVSFTLPDVNLASAKFRFKRLGAQVAVKYIISSGWREYVMGESGRVAYSEAGAPALTEELDVSEAIRPFLGGLVVIGLLPTGGNQLSGTAGTSQFDAAGFQLQLAARVAGVELPSPSPELIRARWSHSVVMPQTVQFVNESSGPYTSSVWDFGDGAESTEVSPRHIYAVGGKYQVVLTIYAQDSADRLEKEIVVAQRPEPLRVVPPVVTPGRVVPPQPAIPKGVIIAAIAALVLSAKE